ncbi:MAG TPA: TetR family transcriptional regulator, partial [Firmicutes bacterium]|nr:TetR family transcriptional regulator [Bacillota bacterium]
MNEEIDVETRIVEKAQAIFARYGFRKTTMDEIAKATHKGKSGFYHYFPSK